MGARTKLNAAVFRAAIVVASIIGMSFQSWTAFALAIAVLLGAAFHAGDLRPYRSGLNRR